MLSVANCFDISSLSTDIGNSC
uniref:Uncharacterized protein n=1 Tax=Anguilla anguilla TaxID=7936 RepID=A0A0E9XQ38_ANGAN